MSDIYRGKNAIHITLKNLKNKYNLKWLRTSMSYHKFSNMGEILQGDLTSKLMKGIGSKDFDSLDCNCYNSTKVNGKCIYNNCCRWSNVVYEVKCKCCDKIYIGNTQQKLKTRINQHLADTRKLINCNVQTDSFAKHFAKHLEEKLKNGTLKKVRTSDVRDLVEVKVIWRGNPISCVKSYGKLNCQLCMNERIAILENIRKGKKINKCISINSNSEIYGACRHRPKFHRYTCCSPSADEGRSPERGKVAYRSTNPSVPLSDITNIPVCQRANEYNHNIDVSTGTDLEIGYDLLSVDV